MRQYNFSVNGVTLNRVSKATAKKMFLQGAKIRLYPCKASPLSPWFSGYGLNLENYDGEKTPADFFDYMVSSFIYYNCNSELGTYPAFYTEN